MSRFSIDGTLPDGTINADKSARAPWYVFDADAQDWIAGPFRWRWLPRLILWWFLND